MDFDTFSKRNKARALEWHPEGLGSWSVSDWAMAMAGEAGEICNAIKKLRRHEDGINDSRAQSKAAHIQDIGDEIADTVIYLDLLATRLGLNLEELLIRKFNAVSEREGFDIKLPE